MKSKSMLRITLALLIAGTIPAFGRSLKVELLAPDVFDMSASTRQKKDLNDVPCALIKIVKPDGVASLTFEGNIIDSSDDGSEVWAYYTAGTKKIQIKAPGYAPLFIELSDFGIYRLMSKVTYKMTLGADAASAPAQAPAPVSIHELLESGHEGDPVDEMVAKANSLYAQGNAADAIPLLQKAADLGHTEAQLSLAVLYENGVRANSSTWTLNPDARKAFALAQKAAQQGYAPAQKTLSRYYLTGVGVAPNKEAGDTWHNAYRISTEDFSDSDVFVAVELRPEYPGGDVQLMKDISAAVVYPATAAENNIQGKVFVQFVVQKDGSIGECRVAKSNCYTYRTETDSNGQQKNVRVQLENGDSGLEQAAIAAVRQLKNFYPGKMNGQPVNVWYTLPITFKFQ